MLAKYHTIKVTPRALELCQLRDLIAAVKSDLAMLEAELVRQEIHTGASVEPLADASQSPPYASTHSVGSGDTTQKEDP